MKKIYTLIFVMLMPLALNANWDDIEEELEVQEKVDMKTIKAQKSNEQAPVQNTYAPPVQLCTTCSK
jgi:hypothetical protein